MRRARGFTLVEIMVVVIIIGVLAAIIVPGLFGRIGASRSNQAKMNLKTIETAIQMFYQDYGEFPRTLDDLVTRPSHITADKWNPPSLKPKDLIDPWEQPYQYQFPGRQYQFDLFSLGRDGQEGGDGEDQDITNW